MELHGRKLWGDRLTWLLVLVATAFIVNQWVTRGDQWRFYLLCGWAVVVAVFLIGELRVGRRHPRPGPQSFFAGWAAYVGEEVTELDGERNRRQPRSSTSGVLEFGPAGVEWRPRQEGSDPDAVRVGWEDLHSWRMDGVIPLIWRASGYLTLTIEGSAGERRDVTFHVHGLRRWQKALREAAVTGPTFTRPEWLPEEPGAELPLLLADTASADGPPRPVVVGAAITPPAYRQQAGTKGKKKQKAPGPPAAPAEPSPPSEPVSAAAPPPEPDSQERQPVPEPEPAVRAQEEQSEPDVPEEAPQAVAAVEASAAGTNGYEPVIGLECHVELSTDSKIFCGCPTAFGAPPNTQICPVCTGQPGSLPVINERAVEYAMRIALALNCDIAPESVFHRKNYFYPDMPKNYQISQYDRPLATKGWLEIDVEGERRRVGIHRVHIEEDTGKTTHAGETGRIAEAEYALVDYNRAGVPLIEIVSEPDIRTPDEARTFVSELRALLQAIGVSDVRMEEGSLRCDANVSVRPAGTAELGTKAEIKNMNSIRSVARALAYEVERQIALLEGGERVVQETRHFDEETGRTSSLRTKEYAFDYRYFPDPDLVPLAPDPTWVERVRSALPELPARRRQRFVEELGLQAGDARTLTASVALSDAFEEAVRAYGGDPKRMARWYTGELASLGNERDLEPQQVGPNPAHVAELQTLIDTGRISDSVAKREVLRRMVEAGKPPTAIVEEAGLSQISDESELAAMVDEVIAASPQIVEQIRGGKEGAVNNLVGQIMKRTRGQANPEVVKRLFAERL